MPHSERKHMQMLGFQLAFGVSIELSEHLVESAAVYEMSSMNLSGTGVGSCCSS